MALLTKDQIFAADDLPTEDIEVPEWGGAVRISVMSGWARDRYESDMYRSRKAGEDTNLENLRARYLSFCLVDEQGKLMFTGSDVLELGKKSAVALERVFEAANVLNAVSEDGMEEAAKNS